MNISYEGETKMSFTFNCTNCGQKFEAEDDWQGQEMECPVCNAKLIVPLKVATAEKNSKSIPLSVVVLSCVVCLLMGALCVLIFPKKLDGQVIAGENLSLNEVPVEQVSSQKLKAGHEQQQQTHFERMKKRTREAWQALQDADAKVSKQANIEKWSEVCRQYAYAYASIDLEDVDPALVKHIKDCVEVNQAGASLNQAIENDMITFQKEAATTAELSGLLGGLLAYAATEDQDASQQGGAIAQTLAGAAMQDDVKNRLKAKWNGPCEKYQAIFKDICDRDKTLADELTKKYGVQFIDAF